MIAYMIWIFYDILLNISFLVTKLPYKLLSDF